jgi:hypothetical protein
MKIIYLFLLTAAAFAPFLADSQTMPPSGQPVPSIWQPLPALPGKTLIFKQLATPGPLHTGSFSVPVQGLGPMPGFPRRQRPALPAELPGLNFEDLRGKDGHLHAPLPPGVTLRTSRPDRIRVLRPDNMACRMTDLARLERMPVRRANNADPMNRLSAK